MTLSLWRSLYQMSDISLGEAIFFAVGFSNIEIVNQRKWLILEGTKYRHLRGSHLRRFTTYRPQVLVKYLKRKISFQWYWVKLFKKLILSSLDIKLDLTSFVYKNFKKLESSRPYQRLLSSFNDVYFKHINWNLSTKYI